MPLENKSPLADLIIWSVVVKVIVLTKDTGSINAICASCLAFAYHTYKSQTLTQQS